MIVRISLLALLCLSFVLLGCTGAASTCSAETCGGCCQAGQCLNGTDTSACGRNGDACEVCSGNQVCDTRCVTSAVMGGGSGSAGGGGSSVTGGGAGGGGGTCQKDCTNRVCDADPICNESCGTCPTDRACGVPGREKYMDDPSTYDDNFVDGQYQNYRVCRSSAGGACANDLECPYVFAKWSNKSQNLNQQCYRQSEYGFPDGLCSIPSCGSSIYSNYGACPMGFDCRHWTISGRNFSACHKICTSDGECRSGYKCTADTGSGTKSCTPSTVCISKTCAQISGACGMVSDGCGKMIDCGTCAPAGLEGCASWSAWSCTDLSPQSCICSCSAYPGSGNAPSIECSKTSATDVGCTCSVGGTPGVRDSDTINLSAGGASCGQAQQVFTQSFCGLRP